MHEGIKRFLSCKPITLGIALTVLLILNQKTATTYSDEFRISGTKLLNESRKKLWVATEFTELPELW